MFLDSMCNCSESHSHSYASKGGNSKEKESKITGIEHCGEMQLDDTRIHGISTTSARYLHSGVHQPLDFCTPCLCLLGPGKLPLFSGGRQEGEGP